MVELVLVSPLLVLLVGGIIHTALAINFWLDMQRIANQGARWAVVDRYPLTDGTPCTGPSPCNPTLQDMLEHQAQSDGLDPQVSICFPRGASPGDPVRVRVDADFTIFGVGSIHLGADAQMRIEQPPNVYVATACSDSPEPPAAGNP